MNVRGIRLAIGVLAAAALLSACGLVSLLYPPVDLANPDFSFVPGSSEIFPGVLRHGTATVRITSGEPRTVDLPHLAGDQPSMMMAGYGAIVWWRGGDWELRLESGSADVGGFGGSPGLTLFREDTDPPLQAEGATCTVTYSANTATHIAGHAECKGLAWVDRFSGGPMDLPLPSGPPTFDHPPFDATITFDATP